MDQRTPPGRASQPSPTRNGEAFVALLSEHRAIITNIANAYCRDRADREDLIQEIFTQLWRSFDRYDSRVAFSTWMYRVALNVSISFYRRERRRAEHTVPAGQTQIESIASVTDVADDENRRILQIFIAQLDELNRALMILYLDGKPQDEIALILGISATNVATKISRIKHKLRSDIFRSALVQEGGR